MNTGIVALLCITVIVEAGALGALVFYGRHALAVKTELPDPPPVHRFELTSAEGYAIAVQSDQPFSSEAIHRIEAKFHKMASPPAAPNLLASLVKQRYVVTLRGGEGDFAGILTDQQIVATANGGTDLILVFEHCATMPTHDGDTTADIAGRVILGMSGIAYLQQVG